MKIHKTILTLLVLLMPSLLAAQSLNNAERRAMNASLLSLIEEYEKHSMLYDEESRYAFRSLFVDGKPTIFSDMMDFHYGQPLPLEEYMASLSKRRNISVEIRDVSRGDYIFKDDRWHVEVTFRKDIFYNDAYGVFFSVNEYFANGYDITLDCTYDPEYEQFLIEKISGRMNSSAEPLKRGFWVVNRSEMADRIFANNPLKYNSFNQALLNPCELTPWNDDVVLHVDTLTQTMAYNIVDFGYTTTPWRVKPRLAFGMGQIHTMEGKVKSTDLATIFHKGSAFEFGVDGGYTFFYEGPISLAAFSGLGLSFSSINMDTGELLVPITYNFKSMDPAGLSYSRHYSITRMSEKISYVDLAMPLYLNLDYRINRDLFVSAEVGAKLLFNLSSNGSPLRVEGHVSGLYANGEIVDEKPECALGSLDGEYDSYLFPDNYSRNFCDVSFVGGLSGRYNIYQNKAFAFLKLSYEVGLAKIHEGPEDEMFHLFNKKYPVLYSASLNRNIARASFMKVADYSRRIFWLELGVNYKF